MQAQKADCNLKNAIPKAQEVDSQENNVLKHLEQFNSDNSWSELDQLEQHLFNGSHEESSPQDLPKRIKRINGPNEIDEEISQYQQALKTLELQNKQFLPFQKTGVLTIDPPSYLKIVSEARDDKQKNIGVAKMLGLKENLSKLGQHFQAICNYIQNQEISQQIKNQHLWLLSTQENLTPIPPQNKTS